MCHAGRRDGVRVRTFLIPLNLADPDAPPRHLVLAVRTDPPPDRAVQNQGLLGRWRAALHRAARQNNARVQTFLVPPRVRGVDDPDQLVYVVWGDATDPRRTTHTTPARPAPRPSPVTRPVTDLAGYRADRLGRARSIASHPSNFSEHDNGDHADGNHGGGIEDIEDVNR
jgi:hypothetical protein